MPLCWNEGPHAARALWIPAQVRSKVAYWPHHPHKCQFFFSLLVLDSSLFPSPLPTASLPLSQRPPIPVVPTSSTTPPPETLAPSAGSRDVPPTFAAVRHRTAEEATLLPAATDSASSGVVSPAQLAGVASADNVEMATARLSPPGPPPSVPVAIPPPVIIVGSPPLGPAATCAGPAGSWGRVHEGNEKGDGGLVGKGQEVIFPLGPLVPPHSSPFPDTIYRAVVFQPLH